MGRRQGRDCVDQWSVFGVSGHADDRPSSALEFLRTCRKEVITSEVWSIAMDLVRWPFGVLARVSSFVDASSCEVGEAAEEGGRARPGRGSP